MQNIRKTPMWAKGLRSAAILGAALYITGCSTLNQSATAGHAVQVVTQDSRNGHVSMVQTHVLDGSVAVTGYVEKPFPMRGMIPGRLLVTAVGSDGGVLQEIESNYHRRSSKSKRAYFSETLDVDPSAIELVRVTHLGIGE